MAVFSSKQRDTFPILILSLLLGISVIGSGCGHKSEQTLPDDPSRLQEPSSATKAPSAEPRPVMAVHFASLLLRNPEKAQDYCSQIWKKTLAERTPRAWIALLSSLKIRIRHQAGLCENELTPKIEKNLSTHQARPLSNAADIPPEKKDETVADFLLSLAVNTKAVTPRQLILFIETAPEVVDGKFFSSASSNQQAILRALTCRDLGKALSTHLGLETVSALAPQIPGFEGSFLQRCYERELRRTFLNAQQKGGEGSHA